MNQLNETQLMASSSLSPTNEQSTACYDGISGLYVNITNSKIVDRESAYVIIKYKEHYLFLKNTHTDKIWLIGGAIENSETPLEALTREIEEEIGYAVNSKELQFLTVHTNFYYHQPDNYAFKAIKHIYLLNVTELFNIDFHDQDFYPPKWYSLESIKTENTVQVDFILELISKRD